MLCSVSCDCMLDSNLVTCQLDADYAANVHGFETAAAISILNLIIEVLEDFRQLNLTIRVIFGHTKSGPTWSNHESTSFSKRYKKFIVPVSKSDSRIARLLSCALRCCLARCRVPLRRRRPAVDGILFASTSTRSSPPLPAPQVTGSAAPWAPAERLHTRIPPVPPRRHRCPPPPAMKPASAAAGLTRSRRRRPHGAPGAVGE